MRASPLFASAFCFCLHALPSSGQESVAPPTLSPEQAEKLRSQVERLQNALAEQAKTRRGKASEIFNTAAADGKKAAALYLEAHKIVDFERKDRPEAEFRAWRDEQAGRLADPAFLQGLQLQLRYLGLACEAAETKDLANVFPQLMSHMDNLTRFDDLPPQPVLQGINGSIFARAYELDRLLSGNGEWEPVPMNVAGIYEKTILPYLRREKAASLMSAWSKRIEQEKKMVAFLDKVKSRALREVDRDKRGREQGRINQGLGDMLRQYDEDNFERETLPNLQWGLLRDKYRFVDASAASVEMVSFIEANLGKPDAATWLNELSSLTPSGQAQTAPGTGS